MTNALFDLSGQVAMVTGTSRGLGQYLARALAKAGADLILTSRRRDTLAEFEAEMRALGRRTLAIELDVRDHTSIQRMAAEAAAAFGQIHILVNNAGCNVRKPALDVSWDDWNLVLDTNLPRQLLRRSSRGARHESAQLRAHYQHRLRHQRLWLRGARSLWSQPRRHPPAHYEPRR